jgi:hypothetical protein
MLNKLTIKVVKHTYTTKHKKMTSWEVIFLFGNSG